MLLNQIPLTSASLTVYAVYRMGRAEAAAIKAYFQLNCQYGFLLSEGQQTEKRVGEVMEQTYPGLT